MPITDAQRLAERCQEICLDRQGEDVRLYDVRETSLLADYYLICSANSLPHIRAISNRLLRDLGDEGVHPRSVEGAPASHWVIMDYGLVLVHLFLPDARDYYGIEALWQADRTTNHTAEV